MPNLSLDSIVCEDCEDGKHSSCIPCLCECNGHSFAYDELKTLYELLKYQYIPYENERAHEVINRISRIVVSYEQAELAGLFS